MGSQRPPAAEELLADLAEPGCPACRIARRSGDWVLGRLLGEANTDPDTRIRLREGGGVCPEHAQRAEEVTERRGDGGPLATLAGDLLGRVDDEAAAWAWRSPPRLAGCQVCEAVAPRVDAYLDLLAESAADSEIGQAARRPDRGVCSAHLRRGLRRRRGRAGARRLADLHRQVAEPLRAELESYRRALRDPALDLDERLVASWRRAWAWVHGSAPPR